MKRTDPTPSSGNGGKRIRYAVVGLGHIAQVAVLPAFAHARGNSHLAALVSGDAAKRRKLKQTYGVEHVYSYEEYDQALRSGQFDAVYLALPNSLHCDFAVRAAMAGKHVLCEKPLGANEEQCEQILQACADNDVKLMTAYRLHFDKANLEAVRRIQGGEIGDIRIFNSVFTMQVHEGNIRTRGELGGGTLFDIGIYCINAARYLLRAEPIEVVAFSANNGERRFREIDEMTSAILRFPGERLASFTSSFGAADHAAFTVIGTEGILRLKRPYDYAESVEMELTARGETERSTFSQHDQFAAELIYFSDCVIKDQDPEPSGIEGLIDVHIIESLYESAQTGRPVRLRPLARRRRPNWTQEITRPPVKKRESFHAMAPTRN